MSFRAVRNSMALAVAASILLIAAHASAGGDKTEKAPKLSPAVGKIKLKDGKGEVKGKLADTDPKDVGQKESYCKIYTVKFEAGKTYQIDCTSDWDNWLRLEDAKGKQLDSNDDTNGTNAQIVFECKTTAEYRVIVTSFGAMETGEFTLAVEKK